MSLLVVVGVFLLISVLNVVTGNVIDNAVTFSVPFEISFSNVNQFSFTINYLENFVESTSSFFQIENKNLTISFVKEISMTNYIDVGFTIAVNTINEENRIRSINIESYRSYLINSNDLPQIVGIESKWQICSNGKYSTFYHYNIECQWLCDYLSVYNNNTNQCNLMTNTSSIIQIVENNTSRFMYIGYISSAIFTLFFYIIFVFHGYITNNINITKSNEIKSKMAPPKIKKRRSEYFYHDTENEDDHQENNKKIETENVENIKLSVKSTRSNSIDHTNKKDKNELFELQSPTTQNEEIFRETTLGPLENMKCNEKLKKQKQIIIEEARLQQFKLLDNLDLFRKNIENEIEKECIQKKESLKTKYLIQRENVIQSKIEKDKLDKEYDSQQKEIENETNDKKTRKINSYKANIKQQLLSIKNKTRIKLKNLIDNDETNNINNGVEADDEGDNA